MAKTKISEFSSTPANNTDIDSINIAEGCAPSNINDAIRELMAQLKDFQTGAVGDSFNGPIGSSTASTGAFTNITASGTLGVTGVATLGAGAILNTPASVTLTNATGLPISTGVSGLGTGVATALAVNVGSAGAPVVNGGALGTPSSGTVTNLTGTASININGTVGATTPTTGAFTTLAASGAVTLSGGTANGVTYLNGSKVLTSGSALTFDGTTFALNGATIGTRLAVKGTGAFGGFDTGAATDGRIEYAYNGTNIFYTGIDSSSLMTLMARSGVSLAFGANGSEGMRLTSTGLGIGTSSPGEKLNVVGGGSTSSTVNFTGGNNNDNATIASDYSLNFQVDANNNVGGRDFNWRYGGKGYSDGTLLMTLNSSGNLGIGTSSPTDKLQVTAGGLSTIFTGNDINFTRAGVAYITATGAGSSLAFGTANTTGRLTLDSAGNLGLGVTPSAWGSIFRAQQIGAGNSFIAGRTDSVAGRQIQLGTNAYYNGTNWIYGLSQPAAKYYLNDNTHVWEIAPSGTAGNAISFTQAMTLDAVGRLLIGQTTNVSGEALQVDANGVGSSLYTAIFRNTNTGTSVYNAIRWSQGATGSAIGYIGTGGSTVANTAWQNNFVVGTQSANPLVLVTSDTERARIDSSGNLLVGTTSNGDFSSKVYVDASTAAGVSIKTNSSGSARPLNLWNAAASGQRMAAFFTGSGATYAGGIESSGSTTSFITSSDYRLKENVQPMADALSVVAQLKPCTYTWKADGSAGQGFIAHELQAIVPQCVVGEKDAVDADGKPEYQGIDTSFLVATLTAALQELNAKFDAYVASHP